MKILFGSIFFLICFNGSAQFRDDFSDGNFTIAPAWEGDSLDFIVNVNAQLQLNAAVAGRSALTLPFSPDMSQEMEWRFYIRQNFSPSSSNYGRVYLLSNTSDLKGAVEGYYLQFGESLSNDAVELFRQDGTSSISICRGPDAQIASSFAIGVKVTRSAIGLWTLWIDPAGGTNYDPVSYGAEALYTTGTHFGILCTYTSGNRSNFYFDDFYAGPAELDTVPPEVSSLTIPGNGILQLVFTERMDISTLTRIDNYLFDPGGILPDSLSLVPGYNDRVKLFFLNGFSSGVQHKIRVSGVRDISGNFIAAGAEMTFTYYAPVVLAPFDIVFSEIMFEPSSSGGLPNAEYVEIFNRSQKAVPLQSWTLTDGNSTAIFSNEVIHPGQYLILCAANSVPLLSNYGPVLGLSNFPTLNNDVGDRLLLRDENARIVEDFTFSDQTYHDASRDDGGYSLERIDKNFPCPDQMNWKASVHPSGGTPGKINSVNGMYADTEAPYMRRAWLKDSTHICIYFSERMDTSALSQMNNLRLYDQGNLLPDIDSLGWLDDAQTLLCRIPFKAGSGIIRIECTYSLSDCPGNSLDMNYAVKVSFPDSASKEDVIINEILFNPQSGGSDYLELFNRSQKVIDIKNWRVAEGEYMDTDIPAASKTITTENYLLFPGDYCLLSRNTKAVEAGFVFREVRNFWIAKDLPDYNSDEGSVWLIASDGTLIDHSIYSEDWHHPLIKDHKGVSLERLSPELPGMQSSNWHSAASAVGYGTPGTRNSLFLESSGKSGSLVIEPRIIFPDNDGYKDIMQISYNGNGELNSGRVYIYNQEGYRVRKLEERALWGDKVVMLWDGNNDGGEALPSGIYIVFAEWFDVNGNVKQYKEACGLSRK